jgi:hypothetical protein
VDASLLAAATAAAEEVDPSEPRVLGLLDSTAEAASELPRDQLSCGTGGDAVGEEAAAVADADASGEPSDGTGVGWDTATALSPRPFPFSSLVCSATAPASLLSAVDEARLFDDSELRLDRLLVLLPLLPTLSLVRGLPEDSTASVGEAVLMMHLQTHRITQPIDSQLRRVAVTAATHLS